MFFFKQNTAYAMRISDWSSDVCSSDLLNFYNWDTYIGENTLDNFKEATGVDVTMDLFDSNDVLFAKFKAGNPGYDVIVPSNDFVERMTKADMLLPLDHSLIPRSEEHTSELQSLMRISYAVFCLQKKQTNYI